MDINYIKEWFKYADNDLLSAERNQTFHPVHIQLICFLCKQATEKYLKGYMIFKGIEEPPKIHNLDTLLEICVKFDERFINIRKQCLILSQHGVLPRYPQEPEITESDMKKALEYAKQVKDFEPLTELRNKLEEDK